MNAEPFLIEGDENEGETSYECGILSRHAYSILAVKTILVKS